MLLSSEGVLHTFKLEPSTINSAASFARVRLTISLKVPFGRRTRHMFGQVESRSIDISVRLDPLRREAPPF
jgi:hypothetical protein